MYCAIRAANRAQAKNVVFPVLFSPISSVSGASGIGPGD